MKGDARDAGTISRRVSTILAEVRRGGDRALCRLTARFDGIQLSPRTLRVSKVEIGAAGRRVAPEVRRALAAAARNIRAYHETRLVRFPYGRVKNPAPTRNGGVESWEVFRPVDRVGVYVPGGRFAYPSTVLMTALVARVAGVRSVVVAVPPARLTPEVLEAARLAGVDELYRIGGAQAIAAMAYGTETIPAVDKIVGPGNAWVTEAKRQVFGAVGIDCLAGPSELVVVADGSADGRAIAADLRAQAEHDPEARGLLLTTSARVAREVQMDLRQRLGSEDAAPTRQVKIRRLFSVARAFEQANEAAPEHLEIVVRGAERWLGRVTRAGAVFLGPQTPAALGDYWAGPSHVLPTARAARYMAGLGVDSFFTRMSVIRANGAGLKRAAPSVMALAECEGLTAHAESVRVRVEA